MRASSLTANDLKRLINFPAKSPLVFLETALVNNQNSTSFLFQDFDYTLTFNYGDDIDLFFERVEGFLNKGFWLCGYFTYEFGYFLEPALYPLRERCGYPLAWLGVSPKPFLIDHRKYQPDDGESCQGNQSYMIKNLIPSISQKEYSSCISKIKKYLEEGLTYQTNLTFKIKFDFEGDLVNFYLNLRRAQATSYMAFINTGQSQILSLSPELFFRIKKDEIIGQPMKGTISRGRYFKEDFKNKAQLKKSKKIKAENLMIVDLLRNDLGKISQKVEVPHLFAIEKYRTLYQMTSTIKARLKKNIKVKDIFSSLFPCGSVTGAPKIKTMQIIKDLERLPRGIYTGAIGYISPQREACFNVAIRSIFIKGNKAELGIGGGIVYDSIDKSEYEEAVLKAKFVLEGFPSFSLIESILWQENKGYYLLNLHLQRLRKSCNYFSIPLNLSKLRSDLKVFGRVLGQGKFKVRITVDTEGRMRIEREPLEEIFAPVEVEVSSKRSDPKNPFLYHKTTNRNFYDEQRMNAQKQGFFEIIFLNTKEELTEGSISNLFVLKNGELFTPPLGCGLLGGVLREHLLQEKKAKEKILHLKDILEADKVYIGNSVRGLIEAKVYLANSAKESKMRNWRIPSVPSPLSPEGAKDL